MSIHLTPGRIGDAAFLTGLATAPWIGLGLIHALWGRDIGAGLQPAYLAFAVAAVMMLMENEGRPGLLRPWRGPWGVALGAILISAAGVFVADSGVERALTLGRFGRQVFQWIVMAVITLVTATKMKKPDMWRPALVALAVGTGFQFLYAVVQVVDFGHPVSWFHSLDLIFTSNPSILSGSEELYLGHAFTGIPRVRGTACEPLYLGNALLLVIPLFLAAALDRRRWLIPTGAAVGLLVATWSRGAWLAGGGAAAAACVMAWRAGLRPTRRGVFLGIGVGAGAAVVLGALAGPEALGLIGDRLQQSLVREDWSNLTRLYSMQAAWRAFLSSPFVGIGWGQFGYHFHALVDPRGLQAQFDWPVVNNVPLMILCETGLVGFAALIAGASGIMRRTWSRLSPGADASVPHQRRIRLIAAATAMVGVWGQLMTFSQYNLPHIWISLGFVLALTGRDEA